MRPIDLAKARASFYVFINIHFMQLPDAAFVGSLRHEAYISALEKLKQGNEVHPEIAEGASLMQAYLERSRALSDVEIAEELGVDRTRLYRGVSPEHGPIPPFEALWMGESEKSGLLQEMAGIYARSGFIRKSDVQDRLDYIGIQLNYLECLTTNEISARESEERERIKLILEQERDFLCNHLGQWVPKFVLSALDHAQTDFYRGHLYMLKGFIEQDQKTLEKGY